MEENHLITFAGYFSLVNLMAFIAELFEFWNQFKNTLFLNAPARNKARMQ